MNSYLVKFSISSVVLLVVSFVIHLWLLNNYVTIISEPLKLLLKTYCINFIMAFLIFGAIDKFKVRFKNILGFIFLIGSFVKFIVYFLVFSADFKLDGVLTKAEFLSFFVPYAICLTTEVVYLSRLLNRIE